MTRIFANANYDFIGMRRKAIIATGVLLALGLVALLGRRINYSIEFTGGTLVEARTSGPAWDIEAVRAGLGSAGLGNVEITPYGDGQEIGIRVQDVVAGGDADDTQATANAVGAVLDQIAGAGSWERTSADAVSPKVGGELRTQAFLAIFFSFFAVLAYLAWRFEWRFGLAAVIATAHDIVLTICFIAILNLEVGLVVVAAVLSMVGYSLNDTIIIFDRVRENMHRSRREELIPVLNRSINETLPRSVLTHSTTLAALIALIIFGGEVIRPFALVMAFGVFTGTFSSIFIAAPVLLLIEQRWPGIDGRGVKVAGKGTTRSATQSA
ncbi:MAG: protein translocase subunit SecF [Gemmatimonadales bacterium]